MPAGATLVSVMDCCHSGTVLDLPYKYKATGSVWTGISSSGPVTTNSSSKLTLQNVFGILAVICFLFVVVVTIHYFVSKSV